MTLQRFIALLAFGGAWVVAYSPARSSVGLVETARADGATCGTNCDRLGDVCSEKCFKKEEPCFKACNPTPEEAKKWKKFDDDKCMSKCMDKVAPCQQRCYAERSSCRSRCD